VDLFQELLFASGQKMRGVAISFLSGELSQDQRLFAQLGSE
jgi:hypothetical protein